MVALDDTANARRSAASWRKANDHPDAWTPLKRARISAGLTQSELARRARLARYTVIRAERPDCFVSEGTWAALALALNRADEPWSIRP